MYYVYIYIHTHIKMNSALYSFNFTLIHMSFSICIYLSSIPVYILIPTYLLCSHQTLIKAGKTMTNLVLI